jgi:hypothetical protein
MNTQPTTAPTILDYHRQNAIDHYDHHLRRVWVPGEACAAGEDNDVTQYLREWEAGVAVARARVMRLKAG